MNPYESQNVFWNLGDISNDLSGIYMFFYGNGRLSSNVYVLDRGSVLVDTGNFGELIMDYKKHFGDRRIEKVIITHAHSDHIGGLFALLPVYRPKVYIHEAELMGVVKGKTLKEIFDDAGFGDLIVPLKGNEDIDVGDRLLRVFYTPGHTPGTICLYDPDKKLLFSSDVIFPMLGEWALLPAPDPQGGNLEDLTKSIAFLAKLKPKAFLPGHLFPVWENTVDHIKRAYFELQMQLQQREDLAYINTGILLADMGDLDGAIFCFDKVLEKDKKHPGACFTKGLALYQKGMFKEAIELFDRALEVYPNFKEAQQAKNLAIIAMGSSASDNPSENKK